MYQDKEFKDAWSYLVGYAAWAPGVGASNVGFQLSS